MTGTIPDRKTQESLGTTAAEGFLLARDMWRYGLDMQPTDTDYYGDDRVNQADAVKTLLTCGDVPAGTAARRTRRYWRTYREPAFISDLGALPDDAEGTYLVCGDETPGVHELAALAASGWSVAVESHWPTLRRDGCTVRWLPAWTGRQMATVHAAYFWRALAGRLHGACYGARPIGSPGTTGRDLMLRCLPAGVEYPCLPPVVAEWLRSVSRQGRIQVLPAEVEHVERVVEVDMRLAYLAVMQSLPIGLPTWRDHCGPDNPYSPGKAYACWRAPRGWRRSSPFQPGGWPTTGAGWVDLCEVHAARRAGWDVEIVASVAWDTYGHPLRHWRDVIQHHAARPPHGVDAGVWRAAWRAMALHAVGAMHGAPRRQSHFGSPSDVPVDAVRPRLTSGDVARWETTAPAVWPETLHPEWSSTIWSRARLRLLTGPGRTGEWHLPDTTHVLGFRTDAIYMTEAPAWLDNGQPGAYRVKRIGGARAWPITQQQLLHGLETPS